MPPRKTTDRIVVHCAATKPRMDVGAAEIRRWHRDRGWSDIGYHYVIRRSGAVEPGRSPAVIGAHVAGRNATSVGVCLVGGIDDEGRPEANFTPAQYASLRDLLLSLQQAYPLARIVGHRDLDPGKACPSFDVADWLLDAGLRNPV